MEKCGDIVDEKELLRFWHLISMVRWENWIVGVEMNIAGAEGLMV